MFFILPVGVEYEARRYPVVTFALMGINTLVFMISFWIYLGNDEMVRSFLNGYWLIPELSHPHTYLTHMFIHAGFFHFLGNMMYLFLFGSCVEDLIGRGKYSAFYLLGGLAAAFAHILLSPDHFNSSIPMCGASGAISACIGGFLLLLHDRNITFRYFWWFFVRVGSGEFEVPAWLVISFWFAKDLVFAALGMMGDDHGGVAFGAHVGGLAAGVAMIALYRAAVKSETASPRTPPPQIRRAEAVPAEPPTIYLNDQGTQIGPFTRDQVSQMIVLGSVSTDAWYFEEGMEDWTAIEQWAG